MPTFFIANIEIPNPDDRNSYDEYVAKVKPIVENHGGEYIVRSERIALFTGMEKPDRIIIIRFENKEQLEQCFTSPEYASIKGLRENSVKATAFIVEQ